MAQDWLEGLFERERPRLRAIAYRLLGSTDDAEDAVQETWLRLNRADPGEVENVSGWLATIVARISIDLLRKRGVRAALPLDDFEERADRSSDPSVDAELIDAVGAALSVVLDHLSPSERFAFVLHDIFGVPFDELGGILDRTPGATKQLASRARNKVRGADASSAPDRQEQRRVIEAFLAAARQGDFEGLIALLHPDAMLDADQIAIRMGAPSDARGSTAVAQIFNGRALAAQVAVVDGSIGIAWIVDDRPRVVWNVFVDGDQIVHIDMHADRDTIGALGVSTI